MTRRASDPLLFAPPPAHNGSRTSRAAAESLDARKVASCRARILDHLIQNGYFGKTAEQISVELRIRRDTAKARIHELGRRGLVVALKLDQPLTTSSGHEALAFTAADNQHCRPVEAWPVARRDWRQEAINQERRAIDAETRIQELERQLSARQESAA